MNNTAYSDPLLKGTTMSNVEAHSKAMTESLKKMKTATPEEKKELLKDFYGSSSVLIDDLFPGTGLGFGFAQTQIDKLDQTEIES